jgi:hypothetical protein
MGVHRLSPLHRSLRVSDTGRERPVIAGVYRNRLRIGMRLEADPTTNTCSETGRGVLYSICASRTYNTYLYAGLPPGPVNNPGKASCWLLSIPRNIRICFRREWRGHRCVDYDEHETYAGTGTRRGNGEKQKAPPEGEAFKKKAGVFQGQPLPPPSTNGSARPTARDSRTPRHTR